MPWSNSTNAEDAALPFAQEEMARVHRGPLGPALRRAREGRGITLADVAETTRIAERYLTAIEDARWGEFTSGTYAIGFVRAFARAVGVPEDWAVQALRSELAKGVPGWRRTGWIT